MHPNLWRCSMHRKKGHDLRNAPEKSQNAASPVIILDRPVMNYQLVRQQGSCQIMHWLCQILSILNSVDMLVTHAIPIRLRVAWQGPPLASQITACSDLPHVQYRWKMLNILKDLNEVLELENWWELMRIGCPMSVQSWHTIAMSAASGRRFRKSPERGSRSRVLYKVKKIKSIMFVKFYSCFVWLCRALKASVSVCISLYQV